MAPRNPAKLPFAYRAAPDWLRLLITILATLLALFLALPVLALAGRALAALPQLEGLDLQPILVALALSLVTTAVSTLLILIFGTSLALVLARCVFPFRSALNVLVELPIVMPPVVAGLALLAAFGRRGLLGAPLTVLGLQIPFTWVAVVLAQVFVASPFYIRAAQTSFSTLPKDLEAAANIDGASSWQVLRLVALPLSSRALLAGLVLSWARALGEFGATILFAGNLAGRTQTMPLLVYGALERDLGAAYVTAMILLALAAMALFMTRRLSRLDDNDKDPLRDARS